MAFSLEELWKKARDEEIVDAVEKWSSTNEESQRVLIAEIRRRGLSIAVPEVTPRPAKAPSNATNPFTPRMALVIAAVIALVAVAAALVQQ
jgi:hypothetical protein